MCFSFTGARLVISSIHATTFFFHSLVVVHSILPVPHRRCAFYDLFFYVPSVSNTVFLGFFSRHPLLPGCSLSLPLGTRFNRFIPGTWSRSIYPVLSKWPTRCVSPRWKFSLRLRAYVYRISQGVTIHADLTTLLIHSYPNSFYPMRLYCPQSNCRASDKHTRIHTYSTLTVGGVMEAMSVPIQHFVPVLW